MTSDDADFQATVNAVEQTVQTIGYSNTDQLELSPAESEDTDTETSVDDKSDEDAVGRRIVVADAPVGPDFAVVASPNEEFFRVQSSYPLWQDIADALSFERASEIIGDTEVDDIPQEHPIQSEVPPQVLEDDERRVPILAAFDILDDVSVEIRKELVYQLSEIFTEAEVKHVINSPSKTGAPHGFTVIYKIFPYRDQFGPREMNDVVERVRMAAQRGSLFLRYAFNVGVDLDETTAGDVEAEPTTPAESSHPDELADELQSTDAQE